MTKSETPSSETRQPRRILFLDMDGVLNSHFHAVRESSFPQPEFGPLHDKWDEEHEADMRRMLEEVDPYLAWNLGFIAKHVPGLEIVISSTWRNHFTLGQFNELFTERLKLKDIRVVGFTPRVSDGQKFSERVPRIAEIDQWRKDNNVTWAECVMVDDHALAPNCDPTSRWIPEDPTWEERFVQTDQRDGLIYSRAWDVITKFIGWEAFKPPVCLM